jgi:isopenicillin N synthase-like dioxygenase
MSQEVPVIDLGRSTNPGTELVDAFRTIGFAYVQGHGVPCPLQVELERVAQEFFSLPEHKKTAFDMKKSRRAWRGYFAVGKELTSGKADQKEGFYFGVDHSPEHPGVQQGWPTFGLNPWPSSAMKRIVTEYMAEMKTLAFRIMSLVAVGLRLEPRFFGSCLGNQPTELFRIFGYPRHDFAGSSEEWGVREHTDMGFLTILKQDASGGLEAKTLGGEWVGVPPRDDAFVLNIGDMLEFASRGVLRSTPHRVRNPSQQERFSYPYFFDPNWNWQLQPIDQHLLKDFSPASMPGSGSVRRWDNLELHALPAGTTYGDFVWQKIRAVFPELAKQRSQ